ncbi:hypothetical protein B0H16DRAFT_1474155 [Mycena metata]|uniref:F-box domain-containing protein n=1 Tax=Mycena metata TaxID=1033252 RepID=A0AAD7MK58_9AGAR|nr:hypothetical protein B0H16DRAFT_1474155 [Mycena metata]
MPGMAPQSETGAESTHRPHSLAADRARIAVIQAQTSDLGLYLNKERSLLQDRLDAYTYPVLTLPNEIVSEIFLHFLPVYPVAPHIIGRASPNVLGLICRKWRSIALSTPALWRGITLSLRNGKRLDQKLRLLQNWLQRSGSCLLSISVDGYTITGAVADAFHREIAAHSARLEYLRLYSPAHPFPSIITPLPFLRALTMGAFLQPAVNDAPNTDSLTEAFHTASLLRSVAVAFWQEHYEYTYPWSQLTTFTALLILPHHCLDILAQASNLINCNVFLDWARAGVPRTSLGVTLPHLTTLILRGGIQDEEWKFLDAFTLPVLQDFEVRESLLQDDPIGLLKSLISRSGCSIRKLYVTESSLSRQFYRAALPMVGSVISGEMGADIVNAFRIPLDEEDEESLDNHSKRVPERLRT